MDKKQIKVLLIEDNPDDVQLIQKMLKDAGATQFELEHAEQLSSGLERLAERKFDLLLLDLGLPDSQGFYALTETIAQVPELPIVVLTSLADEMAGIKAVHEGAQDFLPKGQLSGSLLMRSIHYAFERKRAEKELRKINRALKVLSDCNQMLVRATEESELLHKICRILIEIGGYRLAWVGFAEHDEKKTVRPVAYARCEEGYVQALNITWADDEWGCSPTGTAIRTGKPSICKNILTDPNYAPWRGNAIKRGYSSSIALPLIANDQTFGALNICASELDAFDTEEVKLLMELADDLAYGIMTIRTRIAHKLADEALKESEARFRQLAENIREVFWMRDPEMNQILYVSPAYEEIWGRTCESLYASPGSWLEAIHTEDRDRVSREASTKLIHEKYDVEYRIVRPDGSMRWIRDIAFPIKNASGEVYRIVGIAEDITDHKKLDDQLRHAQKMEVVGQLAGGIAHDFNNILMVIIGFATLLQKKIGENSPLNDDLNHIFTATERAANLTRSLLAFGRKQVINLRPVNLNDIISGIKKLLSRLLREDIELKTILAKEDLIVIADSGQIEQVLINLVTNARDAIPDGGQLIIETCRVKLDNEFIRAHGYGVPGMYTLISVTDTGVGMDEKTIKRIFEPFFTTKEVGKGTGLGLSIVYGIIKQHNGYINAYSEVGKGTVFKIYLPLTDFKTKDAELTQFTIPKGGIETVLLAEDDADVRRLTKTTLKEFGYKVIEAVDGEDAVEKFVEKKERIQLLILDVIMPKKNGKEVLDEIRKISPNIKALFMSGYPAEIIQNKEILEKRLSFVSKPISPIELLKKVREVIDT